MQGKWSQVEIAGKKVDLYEPPRSGRAQFGILYLHSGGLETLVDKPAFTRVFDELDLACMCPNGKMCWWADKLCREFDDRLTPEQHLLRNVLPAMNQRWQLTARRVGLLGISMGGQGALRLAFKHPDLFPVVAGISSSLDYHVRYGKGLALDNMYDSKEQCRQDTALMHVPPADYPPHIFFCVDPDDVDWHRGNDRLHEKLSALGIPHTCDLTTRAGAHTYDYFNAMAERAVRFVHKGLEQESRRLL